MLTGIRIAFIGGDARQLEVIRYAIDQDATAVLIGFDACDVEFPDTINSELTPRILGNIDAVVLPVAGLTEDGTVLAKYATQSIVMTDEHFRSLPKHCKVFTGIARELLQQMCERNSLALIRLMELDEVAILNSIPTAEGAVKMAIENTTITLHGSTTIVLGLGRCGITLARLLNAMGSHVRVGARKPADLARIHEMGLVGFPLPEIAAMVGDADVVFNTVPSMVLTAQVLAHAQRNCVIIDIASNPGGTDFRYAEKRGIKALLAPSLPGIVAPKTAGQIIAKTLCRLLRED